MATIEELQAAKNKLSATNLTNGMPGRQDQFNRLYNFLVQRLKIRNQNKKIQGRNVSTHMNKSIFICGVPGTGKTATVAAVLHKLSVEYKKNPSTLHPFDPIHINGQQIPNAQKIFSVIMLQLTGESMSSSAAQVRLDAWFKNNKNMDTDKEHYSDDASSEEDRRLTRSKRRTTVAKKKPKKRKLITDSYKIIVVDELDLLFNERSQSVFYNLFDWPTSLNSKIIVIAIANAIDIEQKFKHGRIGSRIGWETIIFGSYTTKDLEAIIESRLDKRTLNKCFEPTAIKIITTRIGKMTGDARRTLEICRNALELAIQRSATKVTTSIANEVGFQNLDSLKVQFIVNCPPNSLLLMKSIIRGVEQFGEENVNLDDVINEFNFSVSNLEFPTDHPGMALKDKVKPITLEMAIYHLEYLIGSDMVSMERNKPPVLARLYLKDTTDAFKDLIKNQELS